MSERGERRRVKREGGGAGENLELNEGGMSEWAGGRKEGTELSDKGNNGVLGNTRWRGVLIEATSRKEGIDWSPLPSPTLPSVSITAWEGERVSADFAGFLHRTFKNL